MYTNYFTESVRDNNRGGDPNFLWVIWLVGCAPC
ncbi:hypothetical protein CASFOL_017460 [Castilleja foliolosa]|uniref:Uncharacterized protein n=1 Tax=Castilleja foliolosa TaxID=1961234 RepID=A0ABD3DB38_9LAMI